MANEIDGNQQAVIQHLFQNPLSLAKLGMLYQPNSQQALMDAANNLDFGKLSALGRMFGYEPSPNQRVSEDFGAIQSMRGQRR